MPPSWGLRDGVAANLHVVLLPGARRAAAVGHEFLHQGPHVRHELELVRGDVGLFPNIVVKVIELNLRFGLRVRLENELPRAEPQARNAIRGAAHGVRANRVVLALEQRQEAETVFTGIVRQPCMEHVRQRGHDIGLMNKPAAHGARFHYAGPADEKRLAVAAFVHR